MKFPNFDFQHRMFSVYSFELVKFLVRNQKDNTEVQSKRRSVKFERASCSGGIEMVFVQMVGLVQ